MKSNAELYEVVKKICQILKSAGKNNFAIELENALSISTLPGEIIGEIRLQLQSIPHSIIVSSGIKTDVDSILEYIDNILN